jgi:tetratricopeptide (TPR) repeat protein
MNQFNIFLTGFLTTILAIMIYIIQSWIEGKPLQLTPKKIIITISILFIFAIIFSCIQYSVPALPSGIDNISTHTTKSLWNNEGVSLYQLRNYTGAIWYYDKAIEIDPGYTLAWSNKGYALKAQQRYAEAEIAFAKARKAQGEF